MAARWWLGRVGALRQIRPPAREYDRGQDDQPATYRSTGGGASVDRGVLAPRTYVYRWVWMPRQDWATLAALRSRQYGPGPYALVDASTPNLLGANQASGGSVLRSVDGYITDASLDGYATPPVLAVATAPVWQADRSVSWALPAPVDLTPTWSGSIAQGETDSIALTVPAGVGTLTINLSDGSDDLDLYLYRDGVQLDYSGQPGSTEQIVYPAPAAGDYEIRVEGYQVATTASWTVDVSMDPTPATDATLTLPHPIVSAGWPTPPAVDWTFAAWMQASASADVTATLVWRDSTGAALSESTATTTVATSGWTRVPVTGTAPAGAVTVGLELRTPLGAATTLYVGGARLALDDAGSDWYPGEGLPMVSLLAMPETVPIYDRRSASLTLQEVTP